METHCPLHCVNSGCPDPDFIERNGAWVLTVIGVGAACVGTVLTYFLKSRCRRIRCCGMECDRTPVSLEATDVEIQVPT